LGVKDPRACLFLDDWLEVLQEDGRYLLIVRHWCSCIESLLHRHSRASITRFKLGYEKGITTPSCILPYCEFLLKVAREDEAIVLLEKLIAEKSHSGATKLLIRVKLSVENQLGKKSYLENVKAELHDKDKNKWLAQAGLLINNAGSEVDFIIQVNAHWQDVDKMSL
jgi:hypothetical protein